MAHHVQVEKNVSQCDSKLYDIMFSYGVKASLVGNLHASINGKETYQVFPPEQPVRIRRNVKVKPYRPCFLLPLVSFIKLMDVIQIDI